MITPKQLFKGARIAVIAPASPVPKEKEADITASELALKAYGLVPVLYPSCFARYGYLAGSDAQRADDIMKAFEDETIDGIFCIRGGYGVQRILDRLDFSRISKHPKWLGGYSDITALHIALNQYSHLVTYHTPMPSTEMIKGLDEYTGIYLKKAMFGGLSGSLPAEGVQALRGGKAEGILCGGNLSLVSSSLGTPYEIDTKGKLLFLEDVHEAPYRIDGMINHLRLAGKFEECAGIILGAYTDCEASDPEASLSLIQIFDDLLPKDKPAIMHYPCGHCLPTLSLPLGAAACLDADKKILWIEEEKTR